ncbi:hypothetical protein ACOME3_001236 [Neoechinorhynchus agilis]
MIDNPSVHCKFNKTIQIFWKQRSLIFGNNSVTYNLRSLSQVPPSQRHLSVLGSTKSGDFESLVNVAAARIGEPIPDIVRNFIHEKATLCRPKDIYICDGSYDEYKRLLKILQEGSLANLKSLDRKVIQALPKYKNCYLALSDPRDVARVESRTIICTNNSQDTIPTPRGGFGPSVEPSLPGLKSSQVGSWLSIDDGRKALLERFTNCMKGRTMYVIPYSMGPVGSPLSKYGIQLTDSPYVVACMRIMTRMTKSVFEQIEHSNEYIRCLHSVGVPLPASSPIVNAWPCNPPKTVITHFPDTNEIISFGSGYGGNALCGKKCFSLRIGSTLAYSQGWLAEHMLILGITNPKGVKKYVVAAFPSACGKTNLAMLNPTIPGYKVETVGDDIAWMRFNDEGRLVAINPECGFFGVCPGTSYHSNPNAMKTIFENTIFTNVAKTDDGGVYWEGMDDELWKGRKITSWKHKEWHEGDPEPAAHPNSRFCAPAGQCPVIDKEWENPAGVPIDAIIFGGRRPAGVPLVYEAFDWQHGVFIGASVKSEATAAAEHKSKSVMHDPFAMRPFFGYNFGNYIRHWLSFKDKSNLKLPRIFHVNWFRRDAKTNDFLWPGFGENSRVLDYIFRRCDSNSIEVVKTPIGYVPAPSSIDTNGLENVDLRELLSVPNDFWKEEVKELHQYFDSVLADDLPSEIRIELNRLSQNLEKQC